MSSNTYDAILIVLAFSIFISVIFHRFKIPVIVGYIFVGIIVGPYAAGIITSTENVTFLAELGVVFLMFAIGLEFSKDKLIKLKKQVIYYGGLQVIFSLIVTYFVSLLLPLTNIEAFVIGSVVAMSSTAIVSKQLIEQHELHTTHGKNSLAILLFQDLAVVPMLILIPGLAMQDENLLSSLWKSFFIGATVISLIIIVGNYFLKYLYFFIAKTHSLEIFGLTSLFVTLGAAWITHKFGLSLALGAFLAGILLGNTHYKHQVESSITPFKDVFLGFFFVSLGTQLNVNIISEAWPWVLLLLGALIIFKVILIYAIGIAFKNSHIDSLRTGIILAQGGEFGLLILALASKYNAFPSDYSQVALGAILLSMAVAPGFIFFNRRVAYFFVKNKNKNQLKFQDDFVELSDHVVICGFGKIGKNVAKLVSKESIPFVALELDHAKILPDITDKNKIIFADATHIYALKTAGVFNAKALVICFKNITAAIKIIEQVRSVDKDLLIITSTIDNKNVELLYKAGATNVILEPTEVVLSLIKQLLLNLEFSVDEVGELVS